MCERLIVTGQQSDQGTIDILTSLDELQKIIEKMRTIQRKILAQQPLEQSDIHRVNHIGRLVSILEWYV